MTKKFKALFSNIDEQAIFEIQAFFILKRGIDDFNREFWIAEDKEAELLCKILSVYSFEIVPNSFEPLIKKANKFLREMRKDVEFWKDYKNYKIEELQNEYKLETTNGLEKNSNKLTQEKDFTSSTLQLFILIENFGMATVLTKQEVSVLTS